MSVRRFCGRRAGRSKRLEPRQLLAGDVSVSVVGGNLVVEGDELGNGSLSRPVPSAGALYRFRGLDGTNMVQSPAPAEGTPRSAR